MLISQGRLLRKGGRVGVDLALRSGKAESVSII